MSNSKKYSELKVELIGENDVRRGWVRIHYLDRNGIQRGKICKIEVKETDKKIYRQLLGCENREIIQMDFDTRDALGVCNKKEYSFRISSVRFWPVPFYWKHPDVGLRFAARLGFLGVILGVLSFVVAIIG